MSERPAVGVAAIIKKDKKVLLALRKSPHGNGTWGFPGGHLEMGESFEECIRRELKEETNLEIDEVEFGAVTNDVFSLDKHYITIFMVCDYMGGEVRNMEVEKVEKWEWFTWDSLPTPLFLPIMNLQKQNFSPFRV